MGPLVPLLQEEFSVLGLPDSVSCALGLCEPLGGAARRIRGASILRGDTVVVVAAV